MNDGTEFRARTAMTDGVENLLVVPGAVHIPWRIDHEPVPNDVCDRRAREAVGKLLPMAEKLGVSYKTLLTKIRGLGLEN